MKLESKEQTAEGKQRRLYDDPLTPYARVLASAQVSERKKAELRKLKAGLNPFALEAAIQKKLRVIHRERRALE